MISLLSKIIIKDNSSDVASYRRAYGMLCGVVGIFLNILLFLGKLFAGIISKSVSITADSLNNLSDAGSSLVSLIGFKLSSQKADAEHPYGHGRIEYIAGLIISFLIMLMGFELIKESIIRIIHPIITQYSAVTIIILVISIFIKAYMILYNRVIGKKIDSKVLIATSIDSLGDVIATTTVLICTFLVSYIDGPIDAICGILVGLFIFYSGFQTAKDTSAPLIGAPPSHALIENITKIVMEPEEIIGMHDLIVHDYGPMHTFVSVHAEVDSSSNIVTIHSIIDSIEERLNKELNVDAVIHMDPIVHTEELDVIRTMIDTIIYELDPHITYHDLKIGDSYEDAHKIYFDVLVPMDYPKSDGEILNVITQEIYVKTCKRYSCSIKIDRDYK